MAAGIFSLVPEDDMEDVLACLHAVTGLPVRMTDEAGEDLILLGAPAPCCTLLQQKAVSPEICRSERCSAGARARLLGGAYVFSCPAGLTLIAFPLLNLGRLLGTVLMGPFRMDETDPEGTGTLAEEKGLTPREALTLYDALNGLRTVPPPLVSQLQRLLAYTLAPLLPAGRADMRRAQEKMTQQSRINETIQALKGEGAPPPRPIFYEKETALLLRVRTGDVKGAKAMLNDMLGYVLFSEGGGMETVRLRAMELSTMLSRVAMEGGAPTESVYALNRKFMTLLNREQGLDEVCALLQDMLEGFADAMFSPKDKGNLFIRQALQYMAAHYAEPVTLEAASQEAGMSPHYFSTLFKATVGVGFREQLNRVRVEESKRLLLASRASLNEVALAVGFCDQSHYCKVFRRLTGLSPGQYRGGAARG